MIDYFKHPYCSNSALNALAAELGILPEIKGDRFEAYRLGTLFDAVVTEPQKIDLIRMKITDSEYSFTKEEYQTAKIMKASLESNAFYKIFISRKPDFQKEVYVDNFQFDGFTLNMRAKLDYYIPGIVSDLKSTVASSQKAFENSVELFGYHRQMWLYCKLTESKRAMIFGVSKKKPHKVFVFKIKEGDNLWAKAEKQINYLAFKYYMMKS